MWLACFTSYDGCVVDVECMAMLAASIGLVYSHERTGQTQTGWWGSLWGLHDCGTGMASRESTDAHAQGFVRS